MLAFPAARAWRAGLLLITGLLTGVPTLRAQTTAPAFCGTDARMRARLGAGYDAWWAAYRAGLAARDAALTRAAATAPGTRSPATAPLVIPLVIHVLYDNGGGNIPDEQVYDAVRILNEDFQKRNPDTAAVIPLFRSRIGNTGVEFRLARLDPTGRCTNGIT